MKTKKVIIREDKKRKILKYIEEKSKKCDFICLSKKKLTDKFSDNKFSKEMIEDILQELDDNNMISEGEMRFKIYFSMMYEKIIKDKLSGILNPPLFKTFLGGFFVLAFVLSQESVQQYFAATWENPLIIAMLFGIIGSYIIGTIIITAWDKLIKNVSVLKNYALFISPIIIIATILSIIVFLIIQSTGESITIEVIIGVLTASIICGIGFIKLKKD